MTKEMLEMIKFVENTTSFANFHMNATPFFVTVNEFIYDVG